MVAKNAQPICLTRVNCLRRKITDVHMQKAEEGQEHSENAFHCFLQFDCQSDEDAEK